MSTTPETENQKTFHHACSKGNIEIVKKLLQQHPELLEDGGPLCVASQNGNEEVVEFLLSSGADVNEESGSCTPLFIACQLGHKGLVEVFLSAGAKVNQEAHAGQTPLFVASFGGYTEVVELLLSAGADFNKKTEDGQTPLCAASWRNNQDIVEILLSAGADIHIKNNEGGSVLYTVSQSGHEDIVELLLSAGANIDEQNEDHFTPLYIASLSGKEKVVEVLLSSGADIHKPDSNGKTAHSVAKTKEIADLIINHEQRRGGKGEEKEQPVADADAQQQSELNKENEELKAQLKIMEEEKAVLQSKFMEENNNLKKENDELKAHLKKMEEKGSAQNLSDENKRLKEQLLKMEKDAHSFKEKVKTKFKKTKGDDDTQLKEDEKLALQTKFKKQIAELEAQVKDTEEDKSKLRQQNGMLKEQIRTMDKEAAALKKQATQAKELEGNYHHAQNTVIQLQNELTALQLERKGPLEEPLNHQAFYELYYTTPPPRFQFEVFMAVKTFLLAFQKQNDQSLSENDINQFISQLQQETVALEDVDEFLDEVETIAVRLWTSPHKLQNRGLCSIFNQAIRSHDQEMLPSVVVFARGLNMLCVNRHSLTEWPERTYRGGAMPQEHHQFFEVGKQFRAPQFLSTSVSQEVAFDFIHQAAERGEEPVLWEFHFHEAFLCKHVNLLTNPNVEKEFLFTAYSVFTVREREIQENPTGKNPHKIVLDVAPDNQHGVPENLPLAPWC